MNVHLESFQQFFSPMQGRDLQRLISEEREWLSAEFPGTVKRYEDLRGSMRSVIRTAGRNYLRAFIIRNGKLARGIATVIFDQSVIHPAEGTFTGNDLDYWLAADAEHEEHAVVARELVGKNAGLEQKRRGEAKTSPQTGEHYMKGKETGLLPIMGTIRLGSHNPSVGLADVMQKVGEPAVLRTPSGADERGVTKGGAVVQLYQANILELRAAFERSQADA